MSQAQLICFKIWRRTIGRKKKKEFVHDPRILVCLISCQLRLVVCGIASLQPNRKYAICVLRGEREMSVFGGDSWGREAQYRKRRVDDLLVDGIDDINSYKKLSSGKYACLVCPHSPVLDTPLTLSVRTYYYYYRLFCSLPL